MFEQTFTALMKEAHFTKEMLGSGVTQLRKANYTTKGIYFQAFTGLSTGFERLGKLCLLLDFYIDNEATFPDSTYVKEEIGHDILLLWQKLKQISERRQLNFRLPGELDDPIYGAILTTLSQFAKGDRYSNINFLVGSIHSRDPILEWQRNVDDPLCKAHVSEKVRARILSHAADMSVALEAHTAVLFTSDAGRPIDNVRTATELMGIAEATAPLRQLFVLRILRRWVEILLRLQYLAMGLNQDDIPYFSEIFASFRVDDAFMKSRKTWP